MGWVWLSCQLATCITNTSYALATEWWFWYQPAMLPFNKNIHMCMCVSVHVCAGCVIWRQLWWNTLHAWHDWTVKNRSWWWYVQLVSVSVVQSLSYMDTNGCHDNCLFLPCSPVHFDLIKISVLQYPSPNPWNAGWDFILKNSQSVTVFTFLSQEQRYLLLFMHCDLFHAIQFFLLTFSFYCILSL